MTQSSIGPRRAGRRVALAAATLVATVAVLPRFSNAEPFRETFSVDASHLTVLDLIGKVQVVGHDGPRFEVEVNVQGEDAGREAIKVETREGSRAEIRVTFPLDDENRFVYPRLGRGSHTMITFSGSHDDDEGLLETLLRGLGAHRIRVSGTGKGLEVWADVTVKVPDGKRIEVDHGVGEIAADDVRGRLKLKTRSGPVTSVGVEGDLLVDTGSGTVEVERQKGDLRVDTGSGSIAVTGCAGDVVNLNTGSGGVEVSDVQCDELVIDTGSGGVTGRALRARTAVVDTGSGSMRLAFDQMGDGTFRFDTGSGSVDVMLPKDASADVVAETGSGRIQVDVAGAGVSVQERDTVVFTIGSGAAEIQIDTGSGNISLKN